MKAVKKHVKLNWARLYIERWLKVPLQHADGTRVERDRGTPQEGVISPILANLFMHYAFDEWMKRNHPYISFERYADDAVLHCKTEKQAHFIKDKVEQGLNQCGLELHPEKTRIVKMMISRKPTAILSLTFWVIRSVKERVEPRRANCFSPAVSDKAKKSIRQTIGNGEFICGVARR